VHSQDCDIRPLVRDIDLSVLRYANDTYHSAVCFDWTSVEAVQYDEEGCWVIQLQAFLQFHDNNSSTTTTATPIGIRKQPEIQLLPAPSKSVFSQGTQNAR
jgi:hypothetical protein